jgi:hypothetical protein
LSAGVTDEKYPLELQANKEKHPPELQDLTLYVAVVVI